MNINDIIKENNDLKKSVEPTNDLKQLLVDYVGSVLKPENKEITVEMVITVLASQFPELMLAIAEENFIAGYDQAFVDQEVFKRDELKDINNERVLESTKDQN